MDEDEDFQALFFVECEENLSDLQARLDALLAGDRDPETVNAAFRAVHSVKGGAAAFGFNGLVGFAHDFETVMDRVRSGALELNEDLCEALLRAGDVMAALIEATREGTEGPQERAEQVTAQLAAFLGSDALAAKDAARAEAGADGAEGEDDTNGDNPAADAPETLVAQVLLAPRADFLIAGFDPARIIRAARGQGLVTAVVEGIVPPIQEYEFGSCPIAWRMTFETDGPIEALRAFLSTYAYGADITLDWAGSTETVSPEVGTVVPNGPVDLASRRKAADDATVPLTRPAPDTKARAATAPAPALNGNAEAKDNSRRTASREAADGKGGATARSLRVDLDRVDRLVNLVGEVLIAQAAVAQSLSDGSIADPATLKPLVESLTRQTRELQESVMAIRAQPVRTVFGRLPRVVRDLCDVLGKEARLVIHGEDVEVDSTVIEELMEPLVHMIRNSMDHGIETPAEREAAGKPRAGTLRLSAEQRGGRVRIELTDDGRGIDRERVLAKARAKGLVALDEPLDTAAIDALIFHPGFSTAAEISAVSGRGVGMDVVRRNIQMLGGRCVVTSTPGQGTVFTITLPLTLAVMDGMAVRVEEQQFILPLSNVVEAITLEPGRVHRLPDLSQVLKMRDGFLPVFSLRSALALPERGEEDGTALVIDTETDGHIVVLVDDLLGQRQVVLKSLETNVGQVRGVGGATIMGDGKVALVLDVPALFRLGTGSTAADFERIH